MTTQSTPTNALPNALPEVEHVTAGAAFKTLGLVHRVRLPAANGQERHPTLVMVHGLDGNEDVTWIFARSAGPQWAIISPRAPFASPTGYRWSELDERGKIAPASFQKGLQALERFISRLPQVYPIDPGRLVVLGFSQGAAMCYAYAASHPVIGVAALGGLLPNFLSDHLTGLKGVPVLMLHGTRDETIRIDHAQTTRDRLLAAGADVTYLESEVGHKVSTDGMHTLKRWLTERL